MCLQVSAVGDDQIPGILRIRQRKTALCAHHLRNSGLGVTVLGYDDQLVELEAVAAVIDR